MSEPIVAPRALVIGHMDFAAGIVSAVTAITGRADLFRTISNAGLDIRGLEALVRDAIASGVTHIFSDLPAGSTTMAARRAQRDNPEVTVITGVNLPMLLDFAFAASPDPEALDSAIMKAKASIAMTGGPSRAD
jgi:N-acetylgalactosamine PTS system EIIA component